MKNLTVRTAISAVVCLLAISIIYARQNTTVYKITLAGFPQFQCTTFSMMPTSMDGSGLATFVRTDDLAMDQKLNQDIKNNTSIATMDVDTYTQDASGNLTKQKSYHLTGLVAKSVAQAIGDQTGYSFSYQQYTQQ